MRNIPITDWFLGPIRATRSETILPDGIESDDSDKDRYQTEDADWSQEVSEEDEVEPQVEIATEVEESEDEDEGNKVVVSKKGKEAKLGCFEIAAIRTTVPTTGSKSVERSKRRERSLRSVPLNLCI